MRVGWWRPLPLAIGGMGVLALLKVAALVQGGAAPAVLAQAGRAVVPAAMAASGGGAGHEGATSGGSGAEQVTKAAVAGPAVAPVPAVAQAGVQVPGGSAAELALLQDLRARREVLEGRGKTLEMREAVLAAAEKRMAEQVEQLSGMQARLEAMEQTRRDRDEANWRSLVKTYESMRPRDAAAIFNELEQPVLMQVLDRMKEAKAGLVLAAMQTDRARAATSELAKWRTRAPAGAQP